MTPQDSWMDTVGRIIAERRHLDGALLPILHGIQDELGYVPPEAVPSIAQALNLSRAEVHGVITYYHHFHAHPVGRHVLQVCRAESCRTMGGEQLLAKAHQLNGSTPQQPTSRDGACTVEATYCLGLCAQSPAVMLDERVHARMNDVKLQNLLQRTRQEAA